MSKIAGPEIGIVDRLIRDMKTIEHISSPAFVDAGNPGLVHGQAPAPLGIGRFGPRFAFDKCVFHHGVERRFAGRDLDPIKPLGVGQEGTVKGHGSHTHEQRQGPARHIVGGLGRTAGIEAGSEAYAPLARAIIGGLLVSVVVTVYLVPAAYLLVHGNEEAVEVRS